MSIDAHSPRARQVRRRSGVALIITLALLVLVTVAIVAFMARSIRDQQINTGSNNGIGADDYMQGSANAVIAGLQKEMWAGSVGAGAPSPIPPPPTVTGAPYLMPLTNNLVVTPSRKFNSQINAMAVPTTTTPDPFATLVKQSFSGVPIYRVNGSDGPIIASSIMTTTPNVDGRFYDAAFWQKPQLVSSTSPTDLAKLVPCWVYTDRTGAPVLSAAASGSGVPGNTLTSTNVVGRYAYNVYDIGGNLNANLAGNALPPTGGGQVTYPQYNPPTISPSNPSPVTEIVPGYRGSIFTADLSALNLYPPAASQQALSSLDLTKLPMWRSNGPWPTDSVHYQGFGYLFTGGGSSNWLNDFFLPFEPATGTFPSGTLPLTNNHFTSRQDLIGWVDSNWPNSTWVLSYLTHFSYDTDAPTFTPDPGRPTVLSGENDIATTNTDQNLVNPSFVGTTSTNTGPVAITDTTGNPLVKRRFPLSALSLISNCNPANPPSASVTNQIQYDFGLVWTTYTDPNTGQSAPCWQYKDLEGGTTRIKQLGEVATLSVPRSPNFFELLKAAIAAGSLGKQFGSPGDSRDTFNIVATPPNKYGITAYQIIQIGANIISQVSTNYTPTHINFNGTADFYGVQDFPYLYRTREISYLIDQFTGTSMQITTADQAPSPYGYLSNTHSALEAAVVQPELWNPHTPNAVGIVTGATYPKYFRVVPTQLTGSYASSYLGGAQFTAGSPAGNANSDDYVANYAPAGGIDDSPLLMYPRLSDASASYPATYLRVSALPPSAGRSGLNTFREPCALISSSVPPTTIATGNVATKISNFAAAKPASSFDLSTFNVNALPSVFSAYSSGAGQNAFGFLRGYFCAGPYHSGFSNWLSVEREYGGPMVLSVQYSMDGTNYYTYDAVDSAGTADLHFNAFNVNMQYLQQTRFDPRTHRWGFISTQPAAGYTDYSGSELQGITAAATSQSTTLSNATSGTKSSLSTWHGSYSVSTNTATALGYAQTNQMSGGSNNLQQNGSNNVSNPGGSYYQDPDGVVRLADGAYTDGTTLGLPMMMLNTAVSGSSFLGPATDGDSRPVILNRPFQSVAELGYVFRDTPWRSLDFFTPQSGDSALLDIFTPYGPDPWFYASQNPANSNNPAVFFHETGVVAGRVNLNTAQLPVLAALLQGTAVNTPTTNPSQLTVIPAAVAANVAQALVKWTHSSNPTVMGPLRNRAELVGKYVPSASNYSGFSYGDPNTTANQLSTLLAPMGTKPVAIKQQRECVMRALADVGTTRTWNLLIDVVAQTGHLAQGAQDLSQFAVTGGKHLWVSVAIDRVTGKVIKIQSEPVRM